MDLLRKFFKDWKCAIPLSLLVVLGCAYGLMGYTGFAEWRNAKEFLLYGLLLMVTINSSKISLKNLIGGGKTAWVLLAEWALLFPMVIAAAADGWTIDLKDCRPYFRIGISLWCFFVLLLTVFPQRKWLIGLRWLAIGVSSFLWGIYAGYFVVYGALFSSADFLPIFQTTAKEALGYIKDQIGFNVLLFAGAGFVVWLLVAGLVAWMDAKAALAQDLEKKRRTGILLLAVVMAYLAGHNLQSSFPLSEYKDAKGYEYQQIEFQRSHSERYQNFVEENREYISSKAGTGVFLIVIGESANRDHLKAFNGLYPAETTPWLSKMRDEDGFYFFENAYASYPVTIFSLALALSSANQYNGQQGQPAISILDTAKWAGYETWWISNQARADGNSSPVSVVASTADHAQWTMHVEDDDRGILPYLREISAGGKKLVIVHLVGSHMSYQDRTPPDFNLLPNTYGANHKIYNYDKSICYTDQVLQEIFTYAKNTLNVDAMLYFSDHGEDMVYGHGSGKFTFDMVRIPMFLYLSDRYRKSYPEITEAVTRNKKRVFTNDLIYDFLCGLMHMENTEYEGNWDITKNTYALDREHALTKYGKIHIADDGDGKSS